MPDNHQFSETLKEWMKIFMRNTMHKTLRFSRETGWSMTQLGTLMILHKHGTRAVSSIGEELGVSNAAASQLLDRMVQEGLVLRSEDPADRRVKQIHLSEKGERILHESLASRQSWIEDLARELSSSEKRELIGALNILIEHGRRMTAAEDSDCVHSLRKQEHD